MTHASTLWVDVGLVHVVLAYMYVELGSVYGYSTEVCVRNTNVCACSTDIGALILMCTCSVGA